MKKADTVRYFSRVIAYDSKEEQIDSVAAFEQTA